MLFKFLLLLTGVTLLVLVIFFMVNYFYQRDPSTENLTTASDSSDNQPLETVVWVPYWDQERAIDTVRNNTESIDAIGLFWYKLTQDGQIGLYQGASEDHRIIEFAHQNDIKVYALIANLSDEGDSTDDWDSQRVEEILSSEQRKNQHIDDLVNLVNLNNFDGLALDYESLDPALRDDYSTFVRDLSEKLHQYDKTLEVAIHPKTSDDENTQFSGAIAQDYKALAEYADKLHFMMYTQHDVTASPGPSSTIQWNRSVLDFAINEQNVPPEKIALGIGLVGTHWVTDPTNENRIRGTTADLTYENIEKISTETQHEIVRDEDSQSLMMSFVDQDGYNIIWFNDAKSVQRRISLARDYNLSTVSLWRAGGQDQDIWEIL